MHEIQAHCSMKLIAVFFLKRSGSTGYGGVSVLSGEVAAVGVGSRPSFAHRHAGNPETTNATENNKRY